MNTFICPICQDPLQIESRHLSCKNRHNFDRAKSGYVNLLMVNAKNSKIPGDNKQMVYARRNFLEKGYYRILANALCEQVSAYLHTISTPSVLDAGCGEGYYTDQVERALRTTSAPHVLGVDISKFALDLAAKKNKRILYGVGSIFHIPVTSSSCDAVLNIFAPFCEKEFCRVLKSGGFLFMVIPGKKHLWELKQAIYDDPYENEVKDYALNGFVLDNTVILKDTISLAHNQDIQNLFSMTPYYYKTSEQNAARLQALDSLNTQIEFELLVYRKI